MDGVTEKTERVIVDGIPWVRQDHGDAESWKVEVEGIHVWVKNYGPRGDQGEDDPWWGWRNGVGGSPIGARHRSRQRAMQAGKRMAQVEASRKVDNAIEALRKAQQAQRDVVVTM